MSTTNSGKELAGKLITVHCCEELANTSTDLQDIVSLHYLRDRSHLMTHLDRIGSIVQRILPMTLKSIDSLLVQTETQ